MSRERAKRAAGWLLVALGLLAGLNGMGAIVAMIGAILISE